MGAHGRGRRHPSTPQPKDILDGRSRLCRIEASVPMKTFEEMDNPADLRAALLDQLRHLTAEVNALKGIVEVVPEPIREGRPQPGALSIKEMYGVLATLNESVLPERLEQLVHSDAKPPTFEPISDQALAQREPWNEHPLDAILDRIHAARAELVDAFEALDPEAWQASGTFDGEERDVYAFAHHITQEDARWLQEVSHRLHESNLTGRSEDLPK